MLRDFAAIDFETANGYRTSACSVGVIIVRNGQIINSFYSLIHPTPNYYNWKNIAVHGITNEQTEHAPIFPIVWAQLAPLIHGLPLVAHNKTFDEGCLKAMFQCYQMDYPDYLFYCTLQASRKTIKNLPNYQLHTVSEYCGYHLADHHHALADATACAHIALMVL